MRNPTPNKFHSHRSSSGIREKKKKEQKSLKGKLEEGSLVGEVGGWKGKKQKDRPKMDAEEKK